MADDTLCDAKPSNDDGMWFENDLHQSSVLEMMKLMYDSHQLTDVCVSVADRHFYCHRSVLAATSCYFHAMFTTSLAESRQPEVRLHEVDAESVDALIDYAYTGRVQITQINVQNLMIASSLFQVPAVFEACARYMEQQLDDTNCIGILSFAHIHHCQHLCSRAMEHVEKNFQQVVSGEEFVGMEPDVLLQILSSSELNVDREEIVFEALIHWVQFNASRRAQRLPLLLPAIRCGLLPLRFVREQILADCLVVDNCQRYIQTVESFIANPEQCNSKASLSAAWSTPRSGMIKPEHCILLVGGLDDHHPSINCYNPLTRETYYIADVCDNLHSGYYSVVKPACIVTDDNQIFLGGGNYIFNEQLNDVGYTGYDEDVALFDDYEDDAIRKNLYLYDSDHNKWVPRAPMLFPKSNFALAHVGGKIYCFGGLSINQHPSEIVECYDIVSNQWKYVGMMPMTLIDLSAVVYSQSVYILGGRTGVTTHHSLLRFDPRRLEWTTLSAMPTPRFNFGACVVSGEIYVIGGQLYSHHGPMINRLSLRSVDIYSIEHDRWRSGPPLPVAICNAGATVIDGSLYVCGTVERRGVSHRIYKRNVVYRLQLVQSMWSIVESDLSGIQDFACLAARMHTRKLSQIFRPDVDT